MAISKKLKNFLDEEEVDYELLEHPAAYTAQEIAGKQHAPGKQVLKSVIVKSGDEFMMCVLPAIHLVDFEKLEELSGEDSLELATEEEASKLFPDYEKGAEPPFGDLYGMELFIDESIEENDEVLFNAGTHTDMVKMDAEDYIRLANGIVGDIGRHI